MLQTETRESKRMLEIYYLYSRGRANKEDLNWAHNQLVDVLRTFSVGTLILLPFAPITLPFIIKLGERLGVKILPTSFSDSSDEKTKT